MKGYVSHQYVVGRLDCPCGLSLALSVLSNLQWMCSATSSLHYPAHCLSLWNPSQCFQYAQTKKKHFDSECKQLLLISKVKRHTFNICVLISDACFYAVLSEANRASGMFNGDIWLPSVAKEKFVTSWWKSVGVKNLNSTVPSTEDAHLGHFECSDRYMTVFCCAWFASFRWSWKCWSNRSTWGVIEASVIDSNCCVLMARHNWSDDDLLTWSSDMESCTPLNWIQDKPAFVSVSHTSHLLH